MFLPLSQEDNKMNFKLRTHSVVIRELKLQGETEPEKGEEVGLGLRGVTCSSLEAKFSVSSPPLPFLTRDLSL